jgi:KAP-like P-loop domain-containing protein
MTVCWCVSVPCCSLIASNEPSRILNQREPFTTMSKKIYLKFYLDKIGLLITSMVVWHYISPIIEISTPFLIRYQAQLNPPMWLDILFTAILALGMGVLLRKLAGRQAPVINRGLRPFFGSLFSTAFIGFSGFLVWSWWQGCLEFNGSRYILISLIMVYIPSYMEELQILFFRRLENDQDAACFDDDVERPITSPDEDNYNFDISASKIAVDIIGKSRLKSLALIGPFGSGKSSMVNLIGEHLPDDIVFCKIESWGVGSESIEEFVLSRLKDELDKFFDTLSLNNFPKKYIQFLGDVNPITKWVGGFIELSKKDGNGIINKIDAVLKIVDVKIILVVEDIDRSGDDKKWNELVSILDKLYRSQNISIIVTVSVGLEKYFTEISRICDLIEYMPTVQHDKIDEFVEQEISEAVLSLKDEVQIAFEIYIKNIPSEIGLWPEGLFEGEDRRRSGAFDGSRSGLVTIVGEGSGTPRTLKKIRNLYKVNWIRLKGEIHPVDLFVMTILSLIYPDAYGFFYDHYDEVVDLLNGKRVDSRQEETGDRLKQIKSDLSKFGSKAKSLLLKVLPVKDNMFPFGDTDDRHLLGYFEFPERNYVYERYTNRVTEDTRVYDLLKDLSSFIYKTNSLLEERFFQIYANNKKMQDLTLKCLKNLPEDDPRKLAADVYFRLIRGLFEYSYEMINNGELVEPESFLGNLCKDYSNNHVRYVDIQVHGNVSRFFDVQKKLNSDLKDFVKYSIGKNLWLTILIVHRMCEGGSSQNRLGQMFFEVLLNQPIASIISGLSRSYPVALHALIEFIEGWNMVMDEKEKGQRLIKFNEIVKAHPRQMVLEMLVTRTDNPKYKRWLGKESKKILLVELEKLSLNAEVDLQSYIKVHKNHNEDLESIYRKKDTIRELILDK